MTSELEELIRSQQEDMRYGHRLRRQGDDWMNSVVSLDTGLEERLSNDGFTSLRVAGEGAWRCVLHDWAFAEVDAMGRPFCGDCHREAMRKYARSEKGRERERRYRARPEVRERRNAQARARRARRKEQDAESGG